MTRAVIYLKLSISLKTVLLNSLTSVILNMKLLAFTILLTLFIYFLASGPNLLDILNNF